VLITTGEAAIVILSDFVAVCAGEDESFTCIVKEDVPLCVGVPLICPDVELRVRPVGSVPDVTDQVYGDVPPVAESVAA
jgi:hypothetical protein